MCFDIQFDKIPVNNDKIHIGYKVYKHKIRFDGIVSYRYLYGSIRSKQWNYYCGLYGFHIIRDTGSPTLIDRLIDFAKKNSLILCKVSYKNKIAYGRQYGFSCVRAREMKIVKEIVNENGRVRK